MSMLDEALRFARAGIPVFPCVPKGKRPLTEHGFEDATTDETQLHAWWSKWPAANIGMPTGSPRWDVLDIDVKPGGNGYTALRRLRDAGVIDTQGWCHSVRTPSGGLHLYFAGTSHGNSALPGHHIDYRGAGGYVLVPPSVVATPQGDRPYVTLRINSAASAGAAVDWEAIRRYLTPEPTVTTVPAVPPPGEHAPADVRMPYLVAHVSRAAEGNRNAALYWAANRAIDNGATDLEPLVEAAMEAGLERREAIRTVRSARRRRAPISKPSPQRRTPTSPAGLTH